MENPLTDVEVAAIYSSDWGRRVRSILRPYRETSGAIGLLASESKFGILEREPDFSTLSEHGPRGAADDQSQ
jgi:hypothetical protein